MKIKKLPDVEFEVMQAIWKCTPPVSRLEIEEILKDTHPMASTTLFTLLTRLSDKGFIKIESPQDPVLINDIELEINDITQINNHFASNNINCKIDSFCLLYLPQSADYITSLIFIYAFNNHKTAQTFYNIFSPQFSNSLYLSNNHVVQKGVSIYINNGAENYTYFIEFCNGLK